MASGARRSLAGASVSSAATTRSPPPTPTSTGSSRPSPTWRPTTRAEVAIGCGDPELLALSRYRGRLPARVPLAPHERVVRAVDKLSLVTEAEAAGIAVPHTVVADDREIAAWRGPAVVKARLHWEPGLQAGGGGWASAQQVPDGGPLAAAVQVVLDAGRSPVLQRPVDGDLIAIAAVCDASSSLVALQQQRAARTWPPGAGISTRAHTVRPDLELVEAVQRLLRRLGWVGMVQLQLLAPADGPPHLIDLNGRPYGSLSLALAAGLPLPALWLDAYDGDQPGPSADVRLGPSGVRYSWGGGDLRRALVERRGGLLPDLAATVRAWPGAAHPVADRTDRGPGRRLPVLALDEARARLRRRAAALTRATAPAPDRLAGCEPRWTAPTRARSTTCWRAPLAPVSARRTWWEAWAAAFDEEPWVLTEPVRTRPERASRPPGPAGRPGAAATPTAPRSCCWATAPRTSPGCLRSTAPPRRPWPNGSWPSSTRRRGPWHLRLEHLPPGDPTALHLARLLPGCRWTLPWDRASPYLRLEPGIGPGGLLLLVGPQEDAPHPADLRTGRRDRAARP